MQDQLDNILKQAVDSGAVANVAGVVCNAEGDLYQGAFGSSGVGDDAMTVETVTAIMSMTKAITGAAAMQLVEQQRLELDAPAGQICPYLGEVGVLEGYDQDGNPRLRAPASPVTLRNLLTHTSGFVYDSWNPDMTRYLADTNTPGIISLQKAALRVPLMFDPGERWEYGIGIDWTGQMIEAVTGQTLGAYFAEHLTGPLGMTDTAFTPTDSMASRMSTMMARQSDGALAPMPPLTDADGPAPEFEMGGGGLLSTASDYARFLRMILRRGELDGARVLAPETVAAMAANHIGDLRVQKLFTTNEAMTGDAEFFPGAEKSWGLTFQINEEAVFTGRPAGALMWAGLTNCYYWIDAVNDVAGVFITQLLPFADPQALAAYYDMETAVYDHLRERAA